MEAVEITDKKTSAFRDGLGNRAQFMIKTYQSKDPVTSSSFHHLMPADPNVRYSKSSTSPNIITVEWDPLATSEEVQYTVVVSEDPKSNLQSACV